MARKNEDGWLWVFGLAAVGGVMVAADQHSKRQAEQQQYRLSLGQLTAILARREAELADLHARLGPKNEQVRLLAHEVESLREQINSRRAA